MSDQQTSRFDWQLMLSGIVRGDLRMLSRAISLVENKYRDYRILLESLPPDHNSRIVGVTGPPGAGKSSLVDLLIGQWVTKGEKVAVLCVDPSSPFHAGALLGDRIRMTDWYNHPGVFIRSMASRGSLGGLNPQIIEVTDLLKAAGFGKILIETVGVGQNEIAVAGLADTTVVVLVPENGDDIQTMKSGLLEVADIFVINKFDRPGAERFFHDLQAMMALQDRGIGIPAFIKTVATEKKGIDDLCNAIQQLQHHPKNRLRVAAALTDKAYQLILAEKMQGIQKQELLTEILGKMDLPDFNLYRFVSAYK